MICAPGLNDTGWKWSRTKLITFKVIRWDEMWYVRWQTMGLATLGTFDLFLPFSYLLFLAQIFEELLDPRCDTNHACGTFVFDQRATEIYLWQLICNYIARNITFINIISNINQDHQGNLVSHHWTSLSIISCQFYLASHFMLKMNNFPGRSVLQKGNAPQGLFAFAAFGRHGGWKKSHVVNGGGDMWGLKPTFIIIQKPFELASA